MLTANAPEAKDNNFTWKDFQARNNNELVAILGNFVNRATVLVHKYYGGMVPAAGELTEAERKAMEEVRESVKALGDNLDHFKFREGFERRHEHCPHRQQISGRLRALEAYPRPILKRRTATILNVTLQICANLAVVFEPFTPFMAARLAGQLCLKNISWEMAGRFDLCARRHSDRQAGAPFRES